MSCIADKIKEECANASGSRSRDIKWAKAAGGCCQLVDTHGYDRTDIAGTYAELSDCLKAQPSNMPIANTCQDIMKQTMRNDPGKKFLCVNDTVKCSEGYMYDNRYRANNYVSMDNTWGIQKQYQL